MTNINIKRRFQEQELPDMKTLQAEVDKIAGQVTIGETLFMKKHGVKSEGEYKKKMAAQGRVMKHSHIGWNSWESTAEGFRHIYKTLEESGSTVDRFGVSLDWTMGVPAELRSKIPVGTGLIFNTPEEWKAVGQVVPVQPHFGDHMIGSLNSLENTRLALEAGVTTIGNVSQYYTFEYPGIEMECQRTEDMVKALLLMGRFRDIGAIVHSNLDDGFGSQYHDLANLVGWAMLERYIVEDLMGAGLGHCFGNLFSDPMLRIIFNRAMGKINTHNTPGSMIYGNTIDFGPNFARNFGAMASFSMADAIGQMKYGSGHAICPIPVTEATRIPSADEIIEAHRLVDIMIEKAPLYSSFINWEKVEAEADILVICGRIFFERVLNSLDDMKVDITHPGQLLAVLKAIGPAQLEENFGAGRQDKNAMRGRIPVRPTSIVQTIRQKEETLIEGMDGIDEQPLKGIKVVMGTTDVHEFGKEICKSIVQKAGATVFDMGATVAPAQLIDTMLETESHILLVSTYHGIALSYAKEVLEGFKENHIDAKLIMGGLINENMDGSDLPVDVTEQVRALGVNCDNKAEDLVKNILAIDKEYRA